MYRLFTSVVVWLIFSQSAWSFCQVFTSSEKPAKATRDELSQLLFSNIACPKNVFEFRLALTQMGLKFHTTMVANRGFHNPMQGSFSLFEIVMGKSNLTGNILKPGDFFFGHFTALDQNGYLIANQTPKKNALMIEAFAWDPKKQVFNFYELRGDGKVGRWFYRGDSIDILADNQYLHRQPSASHERFGDRLRCSACHDNGGPIMKELQPPHNDWWEPKRKLDFGGRKPDVMLNKILQTLVPANQLADSVMKGIKKLESSKIFTRVKFSHSLQEQLRPLFCPVEVNLISDSYPNHEQRANIAIPLEFFLDDRLLLNVDSQPISVKRKNYERILKMIKSHFPETSFKDADHAWLAPVKARSDKLAVATLLKMKLIDSKFIADVLSIDMFNPVFSQERCDLLHFIPNKQTSNWQQIFIQNLLHSDNSLAKELASRLTDPTHTPVFYAHKAQKFLKKCRIKLNETQNVYRVYTLLLQRRLEIRASEISANPRGEILEPGFRVIFPTTPLPSTPGKLKLTEDCDVVENIGKN